MKVLITGACGYMGKYVVREFLNHGHEVLASDFAYKGLDERAKIINEPIFNDRSDLYQRLGEPDAVIHLAWRNGFIHNSYTHMNDLSNHYSFLTKMIDSGVKYISIMGSMHEIGYWEGAVDENTPCNPMNMYGIAKNALRQALLLYAKDKDVCLHWLRAYYIYGDDSRGSSIFAKINQAVEDGKTKFPFTSGKNLYDFISIKELSEQIYYSSIQSTYNGIINVCTGKPKSLAEQIEEYINIHNYEIKLEYGAYPDRPYDSPGIWGDATIINKIMENKQ